MNNLHDELRPVVFTRGREETQLSLRYDPQTNTIMMDPVPLEKLNMSDLRRIHGFFRRVQTLKTRMHEPGQRLELPCKTFNDLGLGDTFRTRLYPDAVLQKHTLGGKLVSGFVTVRDFRIETGVVVVPAETPVERTYDPRT